MGRTARNGPLTSQNGTLSPANELHGQVGRAHWLRPAAAHAVDDVYQGLVPACVPYFVLDRNYGYVAASGLTLTVTLGAALPQLVVGFLRLFTRGEIAATPMTGWGPSGERYLRLVFANEPIERLGDLQTRFDAALA